MARSSFVPTLVWVDGSQTQSSNTKIRSHIVKEGYRRRKLRKMEGFSVLASQKTSGLPGDGLGVQVDSTPILKPVGQHTLPAWVSFKLQDALSTYQRDVFQCLPLRLDSVGQEELYKLTASFYSSYWDIARSRYNFTWKYGNHPLQLAAELAFQEPLAFRVLIATALQRAESFRADKVPSCDGIVTEKHLIILNADVVGAIVKRLRSPEKKSEELLNALLSLISRTANANLEAWRDTYISHFRGFRSLFFLRPNPWQIQNRSFELRLIVFETCYSDGCWSFVCPPATFFNRLSEFSTALDSLQIFVFTIKKGNISIGDGEPSSIKQLKHGRIDRNSLIFRFLSKDVPMVRVVNGFHDESLAQMSVLLLLSMTLLEYSGDRRKTKTFLSYIESEVRARGLEFDESQWCLFWILFLTRDPPLNIYSQERVWRVLRHMNVVKAISVDQRARLKDFLLYVIADEVDDKTFGSSGGNASAAANFDVQSLVAELQAGPFACDMCGSRATFDMAHRHESVCRSSCSQQCHYQERREAQSRPRKQ